MGIAADRFFDAEPDARLREQCGRDALADGVLAALLWKKVRLGHLGAEQRARVEERVRAAVAAGEPIRLVDGVGGFKGHRASAAPGIGWAEVFHLAFLRRWLLPIAERYEPGVEVEYAGQGEVATWVDNIPATAVATYTAEFDALLSRLRPGLPDNLRVRARPLAEFYDLEDLGARFDGWAREPIPPERVAALDARLDRAANNVCWRGEHDLSQLDEAARRQVLRRSVFQLMNFYELDARARHDAFAGAVLLSHGVGFEGAYGVRAVEGADKTFWMAEGVLAGDDPAGRTLLLMPDDPEFLRARWLPCTGALCDVAPALARIPVLTETDGPSTRKANP